MLVDIDDKSIGDRGERMVPAFHKGTLVYGEHLTRYESIEPLVKDKIVLDVASGSGYGSYILATWAKKVIGVEIDQASVNYAQKNYTKPNINYLKGSAENIPVDDHSVDVVVSFETIEHLQNYKKFLSEVKRVLKPDGIVLVSTPNDLEFAEDNKFHRHEFTYSEINTLLKEYFQYVDFLYQYTWLYAAVMKKERAAKEWSQDFRTNNYASVDSNKAVYFIAICSDQPLDKLPKPKELGVISELYSHRQTRQNYHEKERLKKEVTTSRAETAVLKEKVKSEHNLLLSKQTELARIHNSKGWRLLTKFYAAKKALSEAFRRK